MAEKIISHLPPRHLDDFLAICIAKHVFPNAEIQYMHPQSEKLTSLKKNRNYILIDIGEDYDPTYNNYDHHQNKNLPCSLVLVAENLLDKKISNEIINHPAIKAINLIDLLGFHTASIILKLKKNNTVEKKRRTLLLLDLQNHNFKKHDLFDLFLKTLQNTISYDSFILMFYELLDSLKLLNEAKNIILTEEKQFLEKLKKAEIILTNNMRVIYSTESYAPEFYTLFSKTQADLLIERNKMNPNHTSVIKNSLSPWYEKLDLSILEKYYKKIFLHANGFIIVLDIPIEKIDPKEIAKILCRKNLVL